MSNQTNNSGLTMSSSNAIIKAVELARNHCAVSFHQSMKELVKKTRELENIGVSLRMAKASEGAISADIPTFMAPENLWVINYRSCSSCFQKFDPDEVDTLICPRCGGELMISPEKRDPLKEPKSISDGARTYLNAHSYIVYLDGDTNARPEDRLSIRFVTNDQLVKEKETIIRTARGTRTVVDPPLDQMMGMYKRRFDLAKNRILANYDQIKNHTLAYYAKIVLTSVNGDPLFLPEQIAELAEDVARNFLEGTRHDRTNAVTDFAFPEVLQALTLRVTDILHQGNEDILQAGEDAQYPASTTLAALKSTMTRYLSFIEQYIPTRQKIESFTFNWHLTTFNIPIGALPEYAEEITKKEAEIRQINLESELAEARSRREDVLLEANSQLSLMKRMQEDALRKAKVQEINIVKAKTERIVGFLENELGEMFHKLMTKDTVTIRNLPRLETVQRIIKNLQFFNMAIGSPRIDEICQNIWALVEDARDQHATEGEREDRIASFMSYLSRLNESITSTTDLINRDLDVAGEGELIDAINNMNTNLPPIERSVEADALTVPVSDGNTLDEDERI